MAATDVVVVGAGVTGLAAALACRRAGLTVLVLERAGVGAGASGGLVGALAPYQPDRWSAKKAFQVNALAAAAEYWAGVAAAGGVDPGHARVGRVLPLADAAARSRAEVQAVAAARHWPAGFRWQLLDAAPETGWPAGPFGLVHDSLSGRLHPRRALASLAAALRVAGAEIRLGVEVRAAGPGGVATAGGPVAAACVILAAGNGCDPLLAPLASGPPRRGVKGQAALLGGGAPGRALGRALLAGDGLYIVPHADGTVAVGSTREADWQAEAATDARLGALLRAASALAPGLAAAPVLERWAGLRPRAPRPEPMLGWVAPGVMVITGSLGIGFGLASALGAAAATLAAGGNPGLPDGFSPMAHGFRPRDIGGAGPGSDNIL